VVRLWFDAVAQWHYPFENKDKFESQFPADYICEAVDQTRGWFYSLHAISTLLFDKVSFKNVICLGLILDGEGRKMSKSKGNIVAAMGCADCHGADAFRWYLYTATPPGQERRFSSDLVGEVIRSFHAYVVERLLVLRDVCQPRQTHRDTTAPTNEPWIAGCSPS
jgi:isoleucyl-tRNA synthetase